MNQSRRDILREEILEYVANEFLEEDDDDDEIELNSDTALISGGIVDSFSMVSLKRFLEKKYKLAIPDAEASPEAFDSVNSILQLLDKYL